MPKLPQYMAQAVPQGTVAPVLPDAPKVVGLVGGVTNAANTIQREADYRAAQMAQEADQIAKEEAQAAVSKTVSEARAAFTEKIVNRQQSGQPLAGMTTDLLKEFDAYSEKAVQAAPELGRKALTVRLAELKSHVHEKSFGMEADARRAQVVTDFSTGLDADSRVLFADNSQFAPILAARLAAVDALTLDPQSKAKLADHTRETLAYSAGSGLVDKSPDAFLAMTGNSGGKLGKDGKPLPSDPAKAAEAVKNNPLLSNMDPKQLQALTERATTMVVNREAQLAAQREQAQRRAEAQAEKTAREQDRAWLIVSDRLRNGIPTDPGAPELRVLAGSPYAKEYQARASSLAQNASVAALPLDQQRARLDALKVERMKGTNAALEHEIAQSESIYSRAESAYKAEPLRAATDYGLIGAPAPLDTTTLDTALQGLPARVEQAKVVRTRTGQATSPFLSDEAAAIGRQLRNLPPEQFGAKVKEMAGKVPPEQLQAFATQVSKHDRSLGLALAAGSDMTTAGRTTAEIMRKGALTMADKRDKLDSKGDLTMQQMRSDIYKYLGDSVSGDAREQIADAAVLVNFGFDKSDPERAVRLAVGGDVVKHNGHDLPVSGGITVDTLRDRLRAYPQGDVTSQLPDGKVYTPSGPKGVMEFLAGLPDARLEPAGKGLYFVRSGADVAKNKAGEPVLIEVK